MFLYCNNLSSTQLSQYPALTPTPNLFLSRNDHNDLNAFSCLSQSNRGLFLQNYKEVLTDPTQSTNSQCLFLWDLRASSPPDPVLLICSPGSKVVREATYLAPSGIMWVIPFSCSTFTLQSTCTHGVSCTEDFNTPGSACLLFLIGGRRGLLNVCAHIKVPQECLHQDVFISSGVFLLFLYRALPVVVFAKVTESFTLRGNEALQAVVQRIAWRFQREHGT